MPKVPHPPPFWLKILEQQQSQQEVLPEKETGFLQTEERTVTHSTDSRGNQRSREKGGGVSAELVGGGAVGGGQQDDSKKWRSRR